MMLMIPKDYSGAAPGTLPDERAIARMGEYNKQLEAAGILLSLDGLHPQSMGSRVTYHGGKSTATDGPFAEAKEVLGGFWMINVGSKEEAVEWAKKIPGEDGDIVEVRQVQEMSDFPTLKARHE